MKVSKFNNVIKYKDKYIYHNSLYGSLFALGENEHFALKTIIDDYKKSNFITSQKDPNYFHLLTRTKFLIDDDYNEDMLCQNFHNEGKFRSDILSITLILSYNCNFNCIYCFQRLSRKNNTNIVLSSGTFKNLLTFVENRLSKFKRFDITWMGGEPLLFFNQIKEFSKKLEGVCKRAKVEFNNLLITNGFSLNKGIISYLKGLPRLRIQVTIDGPPSVHNKMRSHRSGRGTFNVVFRNVVDCMSSGLSTFIRVNVDSNNVDWLPKLFKYFDNSVISEQKEKVHIAKIETNVKASDIPDNREYTDFARAEFNILRKYISRNYLYIPRLKSTPGCRGLGNYEYIIDPSGNIFKCPRYTDDKKYSVGSLNNNEKQLDENYVKWQVWNAFSQQKCNECSIAPLCMGGCPFNSIYNDKENKCGEIKYYYHNRVILKYLRYKNNMKLRRVGT